MAIEAAWNETSHMTSSIVLVPWSNVIYDDKDLCIVMSHNKADASVPINKNDQ